MSSKGGPNIITDGLVLVLDAANTKSYPGSGTNWSDLVGGNNLTLTNGPTFSTDKGGAIVFDGTNDYAGTTNFGLSTNFTYEGYFYIDPSDSGWSGFFSNMNGPSGYAGVGSGFVARINSNTDFFEMYAKDEGVGADGGYIAQVEGFRDEYSGKLIHLAYTYNNGDHVVYIDGEVYASSTGGQIIGPVDPTSSNSTLYIGAYTWGISSQIYYLDGKNYNFKIYNKTLTQSEVQQNYNSLKQRFQ
jgi:hypothetical protein